jgi:hypothetical protein
VLTGLRQVLSAPGVDAGALSHVIHGTTHFNQPAHCPFIAPADMERIVGGDSDGLLPL